MRIHLLGTCAGTEPMPNRRHVSFAVEAGGKIYWFDAGEGCSHTAHLAGVDLLSVRAIFISHTHMDHVGGLGNLLWNIRKLSAVKKRRPAADEIGVYIPNLETWDGIMKILQNTEGHFQWDCAVTTQQVADGPVFQDENVAVSAFHNHHLPMENGAYRSFSYRIEAENKSLVYSGDIKALSDLDDAVGAGCDVLLAETGHHAPEEVCAYANRKYVKTLLFLHHGRLILQNPLQALLQAQAVFHGPVAIGEDGTFFDV